MFYSPPTIPNFLDLSFSFSFSPPFFIHTISHFYFSLLLLQFISSSSFFFISSTVNSLSLSLSLSRVLQNINSACICILNLVSCCAAVTPPFCLYFQFSVSHSLSNSFFFFFGNLRAGFFFGGKLG